MKSIDLLTKFSAAAMLSAAMLFAVSCEETNSDNGDGDDSTPTVTVVDPSSVASEALVAYFPLESESEAISMGDGITFTEKIGAASFADGRRGNCYKGSADAAYLAFALGSSNKITSMKGYTVAMWIKSPAAGGAAPFFAIDGGDATMGSINIFLEGGSNADTLDIKHYLYNTATNWKGQDHRVKDEPFLSDKWFHLVVMYDGQTSKMSYYANAEFVADQTKYADGIPAGGTEEDQPLLGELTLSPDSKNIYIGAWPKQVETPDAADSWMKYFPGLVDEIRVYSRALTEEEIKALYDAEVENIG